MICTSSRLKYMKKNCFTPIKKVINIINFDSLNEKK